MRLSVQPAATATLAATPQRHRPGRPWQKSLVGPGDVARLFCRPTQLALPPASDSHLGPHSNPAGNPGADAHAPRSPQSPVAFARDVLGVGLWHKQEEVLKALTSSRRVAVKAGNGLGKGFCAAVAVLWFVHTHPEEAIVLTTAPTFRQVRHILWRQIHRLYRPGLGRAGRHHAGHSMGTLGRSLRAGAVRRRCRPVPGFPQSATCSSSSSRPRVSATRSMRASSPS